MRVDLAFRAPAHVTKLVALQDRSHAPLCDRPGSSFCLCYSIGTYPEHIHPRPGCRLAPCTRKGKCRWPCH